MTLTPIPRLKFGPPNTLVIELSDFARAVDTLYIA